MAGGEARSTSAPTQTTVSTAHLVVQGPSISSPGKQRFANFLKRDPDRQNILNSRPPKKTRVIPQRILSLCPCTHIYLHTLAQKSIFPDECGISSRHARPWGRRLSTGTNSNDQSLPPIIETCPPSPAPNDTHGLLSGVRFVTTR